jgi:hypothetical protein
MTPNQPGPPVAPPPGSSGRGGRELDGDEATAARLREHIRTLHMTLIALGNFNTVVVDLLHKERRLVMGVGGLPILRHYVTVMHTRLRRTVTRQVSLGVALHTLEPLVAGIELHQGDLPMASLHR